MGNALNIFVLVTPPGSFYPTSTDPRFFQIVDGCTTLVNKRAGHRATVLKDGKVLITGGAELNANGVPATPVRSAELFDPQTGLWDDQLTHKRGGTQEPGMSNTRAFHTATQVLTQGGSKVVVGGGRNATQALSSIEIYDPETQGFRKPSEFVAGFTDNITTARSHHTAVGLPGPAVAFVGGFTKALSDASMLSSTDVTSSIEIYPLQTGTVLSTNQLGNARAGHCADFLPDGSVLVSGGFGGQQGVLSSVEAIRPGEMSGEITVTPIGAMTSPRFFHSCTLLTTGMTLFAGGGSGNVADMTLGASELYNP